MEETVKNLPDPPRGLARLFWYIRLYFLMVGQYMKVRLQYRLDFVVSTFGILLINVSTILGLAVVLESIPNLDGFTWYQLVFIYAFSLVAQSPLQIMFDNIWRLRFHVNEGTFITYYFKPLPTLFTYTAEMLDLKGFGQLFFGCAALGWSAANLGIAWTLDKIILLPLLLGGSALIFVGLMLIAASASFWVKDSFAILAFMGSFREHARYPMGIYDNVFKLVFTWVIPVGFVAFYPSQLFLSSEAVPWTAYLSPVLGMLIYWLAIQIWNRGTRVWGGTGS